MFNLGLFELTLFGIIALIVLGPEKLLIVARTLGRWYGMARRTTSRLQQEFSSQLDLLETQAQLKQEIASFKESERKMQSQMARLEQTLSQRLSLSDIHTSDSVDEQALPQTDNEPSAWEQIAQWGNDDKVSPMVGAFFVLGEYDKKRRLPNAPFLPNYQADPLLSSQVNVHQINSNNQV